MTARAAIFALIAAYILVGPFYRQILGGRSPLVGSSAKTEPGAAHKNIAPSVAIRCLTV